MSADERNGEGAERGVSAESAEAVSGVDQRRRSLLAAGSTLLMAGGLAGGYGTFFAMAGRYLFPSDRNKAWMFVSDLNGIAPGASRPFVSPTGVPVTVTRRADMPSTSRRRWKTFWRFPAFVRTWGVACTGSRITTASSVLATMAFSIRQARRPAGRRPPPGRICRSIRCALLARRCISKCRELRLEKTG